jgi:hypothetical protein
MMIMRAYFAVQAESTLLDGLHLRAERVPEDRSERCTIAMLSRSTARDAAHASKLS